MGGFPPPPLMSDEDRPAPGQDARERRRQQHKPTRRVTQPVNLRKLVVPAIVILGVGALATAMILIDPGEDCPGHWHSTFQVWVDDEIVTSYTGYSLENGNLPTAMHMHRGSSTQYEIHWEPPVKRCAEFDDFFRLVDTSVSKDRLTLDGLHEDTPWGGTHVAEGNATLTFYHKPADGRWRAISASSFNDRQPQDGERMLVLFGDYTDERIREIQDGVPYPPATGTDPEHS